MKYPRTPHLPWSLSKTTDDISLSSVSHLIGKDLVFTEKLDGENIFMSRDDIHCRSLDSKCSDQWNSYVKNLWSSIRYNIPYNIGLYVENLYGIHSIEYGKLPYYIFVFNAIDLHYNIFLSWDEIIKISQSLEISTVPDICYGKIKQLEIPEKSYFGNVCEGYVVRNVDFFPIDSFSMNTGKCVRANHVQTDEHWKTNWKKAKLLEEK